MSSELTKKQKKLKQAIKMHEAMKTKSEAFVLMSKMDELEEKIEAIKMPDNADIKNELCKIKEELEKELTIELEIV